MHPPSTPGRRHSTRRRMIQGSFALGAIAAIGAPRGSFAQGTPQASPVAGGYADPEALIDVASLDARLGDRDLVVVGLMPVEEHETVRVPRSLQIDWPEMEVIDTSDASIGTWNRTLAGLIGDLGIRPEHAVAVYDNGTLFAARLWWVLRYLGHEQVAVLDGGLPAWQAAGLEMDDGPLMRTKIKYPPYAATPNADLLAQLNEVVAALDDPDVVILDARTPDEYAEGHIPGAVNVNFPLNAAAEPPKLYKPADELRAMYEGVGVTADKLVIPYCTSGVRSAVAFHSLHLLGYERLALYTGSWQEWSEHPDTPRTEGDQP